MIRTMPARTTDPPRSTRGSLEQDARSIEQRTWFRHLAQIGLTARAVIYLVVAGLALEIAAKDRSSAQADSEGAFKEIARQPSGPFLLGVLACGLAAYAVWRLVQAVAGEALGERGGSWIRIGRAAIGALYLLLCAEVIELIAGASATSVSSHPEPLVARVLKWPGGPEMLGLVAATIAGGGIALGAWGFVHDYAKVIDAQRLGNRFPLARITGAVGEAARGLLVVIVAAYLFFAAATDDPKRSLGLGNAVQSLVHDPLGLELLGFIATGLLAFSAYSVIEAAFRRSAA